MANALTNPTPTHIHIGLPHSGSTFLRSYFTFHPEITWSRNANLFMRVNFDPGTYKKFFDWTKSEQVSIDMYELLAINFFVPDDPREIEKLRFKPNFDLSGQQLALPDKIPSRIKETLPDAKIIFVLRNQVDWLRSHYVYHIQNMPPGHRRFVDYLSCLDGKRILLAGHFDLTIEAYQKIFGKNNVHILLLEQIKNELEETLRSLCQFMGISYLEFPRKYWDLHTGKPLLSGRAIQALSGIGIQPSQLKPLRKIYGPIVNSISKKLKPEVVSSDELLLIRALYGVSNNRTRKLTGIDLARYEYPL